MTAQDLSATLPLLLLTGWACVLMLLDAFIPAERKDLTAGLAALGIVVALGALAPRFGPTTEPFGGMLVVDGFGSFLDVVFLGSGLLGIALAYDYLKRMGIERGEYYSLLLFSICGMMLMGRAADLIIVFLALELLSIPLYVLSGFAVPRLESEEAALKYFLLGAFATGFVVYGIALTYGALGSTRMEAILATVRPVIGDCFYVGGRQSRGVCRVAPPLDQRSSRPGRGLGSGRSLDLRSHHGLGEFRRDRTAECQTDARLFEHRPRRG